ncbi:MAG: type IV pilus modification protein PilV [Comamonadaceae bacterium]|nr:MAG: type IV pilus modification protein PilV [Comamonadaceae bacterium]
MHLSLPSTARRQRGIALMESLVAIVIAAIGILGVLGVQMRTLSDTQTTVRRAQAIRLIEDLSERLKVHPNALGSLSSYTSGFSNVPTTGDCATSACDRAALAAYDLRIWKQAVAKTLPLGQASIFTALGEPTAASRRQLGVVIAWRENERGNTGEAYKNEINATKIKQADGSFTDATGGGENACPENYTCHIQYIPVPARCAPYLSGGFTQYFCPGA